MILQGPRKRPGGSRENPYFKNKESLAGTMIQIRILRKMTRNIKNERRLKECKECFEKGINYIIVFEIMIKIC